MQVETPTSGDRVELALLPSKFVKCIWIKRGDFVLISVPEESTFVPPSDTGNKSQPRPKDKVQFMISHILSRPQCKHLRSKGLWPAAFSESADTDTPNSANVFTTASASASAFTSASAGQGNVSGESSSSPPRAPDVPVEQEEKADAGVVAQEDYMAGVMPGYGTDDASDFDDCEADTTADEAAVLVDKMGNTLGLAESMAAEGDSDSESDEYY